MKRQILLILCICALLNACSRKSASEDQIRADERQRIAQEDRAAQTPKARTIAAWKALQNADDAAHDVDLPKADFSNLLFYRPAITSARKVAQLYSQIDTEGIDSSLTSHIDDVIKAYREYSSSLQETYTELRTLALATEKNAAASRRLGEFLSEENQKNSGGDVAEFLYRLATDTDFGRKSESIVRKHSQQIYEASEKCQLLSSEAEKLAQTLGEKYGTHLPPRKLLKTHRSPHETFEQAMERLKRRREELSKIPDTDFRKTPSVASPTTLPIPKKWRQQKEAGDKLETQSTPTPGNDLARP